MAKSKAKPKGDVLPGEGEEVANDPTVRAFELAAGNEEKLTAFDLRVRLFLFHYVQSFDASRAARKMGITNPMSAATLGSRYLKHPKTQKLLCEMLRDLDAEIEVLRRQTLHLAFKEATNDEMCPGSQGARVKAIDILGKFLGMHNQNVNVKTEGLPGVLAVPFAATPDEWEATAKASQEALQTSDPEEHITQEPEILPLPVRVVDGIEDPHNVL